MSESTRPPTPDSTDTGLLPPAEEAGSPWPRRILGLGKDLVVVVISAAVLLPIVGWLRAPDLPEQAPDFTLPDLDHGSVHLADLRGQVVVLNFWATWCGPCRVEVPSLTAFAEAHPEIPVLGLAVDGTTPQLKAAQQKLGMGYPVLRVTDEVQAAYDVHTLPTTVVVGPAGEVWSAHTGLITRPQLWWATRGFFEGH